MVFLSLTGDWVEIGPKIGKPQKAMYPKVCTANQTNRNPYGCCLPNSSACYNSLLNNLEDVTFRYMPNHLAGPEVRLEIMEARIVYIWNSASLSDLTEL